MNDSIDYFFGEKLEENPMKIMENRWFPVKIFPYLSQPIDGEKHQPEQGLSTNINHILTKDSHIWDSLERVSDWDPGSTGIQDPGVHF